MATYNYTRNLVNGVYDINNYERVDGEGNPKALYKDIHEDVTLPQSFTIECNSSSCDITFSGDLTQAQQDALDIVVSNHQNDV